MFLKQIEQLFPSMFQRRLLLLAALIALSMLILSAKIAHLTLVQGTAHRAQAEAKLVRHQWAPTVRGRILDRKGRVLARDRASYDVAIAYRVITGQWATDRARAFVHSLYREQWRELTEPQRTALVNRALPAYQRLVEDALGKLVGIADTTREALNGSMLRIREGVERMHTRTVDSNRDAELKAAGNRGDLVTPALLGSIERRVDQPIREMKIPHRVLSRLSDQAALNLQFLLDEQVELTPIPEEIGPRSIDRVDRLPGITVFDAGDREYPYDAQSVEIDYSTFPGPLRARRSQTYRAEGVASHILGEMRDNVHKEDYDARAAYLDAHVELQREAYFNADGMKVDRGEYRDGDRVGHSGVESGYENTLRGLRGWRTKQLDTDATTSLDALPGHDIRLTLDIQLQARVQALMDPNAGLAVVQPWQRRAVEEANPTMPDGTPITGAAVVLDIDTGEILAMVSTPELPRSVLHSNTNAGDDDPVMVPLVNRAINRGYPPGSIVKPLILCGAVQHNNYTLDQRIACTGHLFPNSNSSFRCWIYKHFQTTHTDQLGHDLEPTEAIMVSCNIFFFTLGKRLGVNGITDTYREFGVGSPFHLNIGPEEPGFLGAGRNGEKLKSADAIQMGIGQGPVTWTPLHAAQAYATLARYGYVIPPRIDLDAPKPEPVDLHLDSRAVAAAIEGLRRSTNEDLGTGNHLTINDKPEPIFDVTGLDVIGKTGTAAAPRILAPKDKSNPATSSTDDHNPDPNAEHDGDSPSTNYPAPNILRAGDHSWFVVLVGPHGDRPRYAISVVMDYAGSGGKVSGPIINQIIHALQHEGYL